MTHPSELPNLTGARPSTTELFERFQPVFDSIATGTLKREQERLLPFDAVEKLRNSGFTAVSVPQDLGGAGASVTQLFALLIRLGEADSNLPQLLRAHFATVQGWLLSPEAPQSREWLKKVAAGAIFGNGSHERGTAKVGQLSTTLTPDSEGWHLDGTKYYTTGTLFSDWISVSAQRPDGSQVEVIAHRHDPGVNVVDDWNGFGQRLTGSGTTHFNQVSIQGGSVREHDPDHGRTPLPAFLQLVLLATLAGVGRAAVRDAAAFVRGRTRVYSQGVGASAAEDPLVQQEVGRLSAQAAAAEALVLQAAATVERAMEKITEGEGAEEQIDSAELAVVQTQLVVIDLVLRTVTSLFEVGGGSAVDADLGLDRHWRNARTLASHNPAIYQARIIGDHVINDAPLQYFWTTGQGKKQ